MRNLIVCTTLIAALMASTNVNADEPAITAGDEEASGPSGEVDTGLPMGAILFTSFSVCVVAVGAGFGWQADTEYDSWKAAQKAGDGEAMDDIAADVKKHSIAANVLLFGGAALTAVGIIWWVIAARKDDESLRLKGGATVSWRPLLGPTHAGLSVEF